MERNQIKYDGYLSDDYFFDRDKSIIEDEFYLNLLGQQMPFINGKRRCWWNIPRREIFEHLDMTAREFNLEWLKWLKKHKLAKIKYYD